MKICCSRMRRRLKRFLLAQSSLAFSLLLLIGTAYDGYGMEDSTAFFSVGGPSEESGHMPTLSDDYLKKLFDVTRNAVLSTKVPVEATTQVLSLAYVFPSFTESRELFKCVATYEPFSLSLPYCKDVPSVFHFIVAMVNYLAQKDPLYYEHFLTDGGLALISWLVDQKIEDRILSEGKTAAEKAAELGLREVAEHMMCALSSARGNVRSNEFSHYSM